MDHPAYCYLCGRANVRLDCQICDECYVSYGGDKGVHYQILAHWDMQTIPTMIKMKKLYPNISLDTIQ